MLVVVVAVVGIAAAAAVGTVAVGVAVEVVVDIGRDTWQTGKASARNAWHNRVVVRSAGRKQHW